MKRLILLIAAIIPIGGISLCQAQEAGIVSLQTDYLEAPLGIDNPQPRLSWQMLDSRQGAKQTYYRVLVDKDSTAVANGKGNAWDTGKVSSDAMRLTYAGSPLEPFTKYYWKVIAGDMKKQKTVSAVTSFETGMMSQAGWSGYWISDERDINAKEAPYFRKSFTTDKTIKSARAYIAVAGLYELYINGEKIGNHRLDPMFTRFDRRNLYVTYDVTE